MLKEFYINYEECKLFKSYKIFFFYKGFILTMRNVNLLCNNFIQKPTLGFILTMRNVNLDLDVLYNRHNFSFILTMRNVNILTKLLKSLYSIVLY
ncbi:TPA: hypothetical protein I9064_002672 [Clostridium perfringens]|nr:hypothetical protein [Clostridium perfringens]